MIYIRHTDIAKFYIVRSEFYGRPHLVQINLEAIGRKKGRHSSSNFGLLGGYMT